jgi:hypothetical protein
LGALAVAIWCAAVARASPSLAYFLLPLTGHFDSSSTTRPFADFFFASIELFARTISPFCARNLDSGHSSSADIEIHRVEPLQHSPARILFQVICNELVTDTFESTQGSHKRVSSLGAKCCYSAGEPEAAQMRSNKRNADAS